MLPPWKHMREFLSRCIPRSTVAGSWAWVASTWLDCHIVFWSCSTPFYTPSSSDEFLFHILTFFTHLLGLWWNLIWVLLSSEQEHLFLCWLAIGVSFSVIWLFRVFPYFWFGPFLSLTCRNSIHILGTFRSLIQVELVLCECWEVRINFCLFFSFFYFQHSWHFIFVLLFIYLFASKYNHISVLVLYSKLSAFFFFKKELLYKL